MRSHLSAAVDIDANIDTAEVGRIESVVAAHALPTRLRSTLSVAALTAAMARDKKARAGSLRFVLLGAIGKAVVRRDVPAAEVGRFPG